MTRDDTIISLAINSWINRDRVVWPGANLRGADLRGAKLRGADLRGANLRGADLIGSALSGADLRYANLRYADLRYAILRYADLCYANLRGADLIGADLIGAKSGGKLEAVTDPGDWLETAATLWEVALDWQRPLYDTPEAELVREIRRTWGIAATRDMIARAAPDCWAAYVALSEDERSDMAFDADWCPSWLAQNLRAIAVAADLHWHDLIGADLSGVKITLGNRAFTLTKETEQ